MTAAFEKLKKILRLEKSRDYRNEAMIGGLESYANTGEARPKPRPRTKGC